MTARRIAIVHPFPWPEVRRGAERYLEDLAHYLAGRGHRVEVVTGTDGPRSRTRRPDGVWVVRRPHLLRARGARLGVGPVETFGARALRPLVAGGYDVVHAFTPSGALAGWAARRPTVYSVLGHPAADQLPGHVVPRHLFAAAVRRATVAAVLSGASARALEDTTGRPGTVLPPGVRLDRFPPRLGPRPGPPRLLLSASLADRRKRAELAVTALAGVLEHHPDARLALSGEGDPGYVLAAAAALGPSVRAAVDVLGPGDPDEVPARYREATVTVLPADHEAFGLALVESLASGTPVVCAPSAGMPEIVDDPAVGRVAAAATGPALARAVLEAVALAARPDTAARCRAHAARWDWDEAVGPRHEALYEALLGTTTPAVAVGS